MFRHFVDKLFLLAKVVDQGFVGDSTERLESRQRVHSPGRLKELYGLEWYDFSVTNCIATMINCHSLACSDPRDRIYAIYHMLRLDQLPGFVVDYTTSALHTYQRFFSACPDHQWREDDVSGFHLLLSLSATVSRMPLPPWPSWLPDFQNLTARSECQDHIRCEAGPIPRLPGLPPYRMVEGSIILEWAGQTCGTVLELLDQSAWP